MDRGEYLEAAVTIRKFQNVEFENPRYQDSLRVIPSASLFLTSILFMATSIGFDFGRLRNNGGAPLCRRTEQAVKSSEIHSGSRDQNGEPGFKFQRLKDQVRYSVSPGCAARILDLHARKVDCTIPGLDLHARKVALQPGSSICTSGEWVYNGNPLLHKKTCTLQPKNPSRSRTTCRFDIRGMRLEREGFVQLQIAVISGVETGKVLPLAPGDFVIGRDDAADLQIPVAWSMPRRRIGSFRSTRTISS